MPGDRIRQRAESVPILEQIKTWLDTESHLVLPRSPMSQAIAYAHNQWAALGVYTTQGFLNIDNNAAERALKRVALGRKNWLFAGNDAAAANHAKLWTLIASAERHGVDPQRYLTSVLANLPLLRTSTPEDRVRSEDHVHPEDLEPFLPDTWAKDDAAHPATPS